MTEEIEKQDPVTPQAETKRRRFRVGDAIVDPLKNTVRHGGETLSLEAGAMDVLVYLAERQHLGDCVNREDILEACWPNKTGSSNALSGRIHAIRTALKDTEKDNEKKPSRFIASHYGRGYELVADVVFEDRPVKEVQFVPLLEEPPAVGASTPIEASPPSAGQPQRSQQRFWLALSVIVVASLIYMLATTQTASPRVDASAYSPPYSVAVLVLRSDDLTPPLNSLGKSISEELITSLGMLNNFKVITGTTSFGMSGQSTKDIGSVLGVDFVLGGRITDNGEFLELVADLAETEEELVVWSARDSYHRDDVRAASSRIAREIARALDIRLSSNQEAELAKREGRNPEAFGLYLAGNAFLNEPRSLTVLQDAFEKYSEALRRDRDFVGAQAGMCRSLVALYRIDKTQNYFEEAEKSCNALARSGTTQADAKIALGMLYRERGDHALAIETFGDVIRAYPNSVLAIVELGDTYAAANRDDLALLTYRRAVRLAPNEYIAQAALGVFHYNIGEYHEALKRAIRAVGLNPANPVPRNFLAASHYALEDFDSADREWEESIRIEPTRVAYTNLGLTAYYRGEFAKAEEFQRRALQIAPNDHRGLGRLAESIRHQGNRERDSQIVYEDAARAALRRIGENSKDEFAHARLGNFKANLGQADQAAEYFAKARSLAPKENIIHYMEATAWAAFGDIEKTRASLEKAVALGYSKRLIRRDPDIRALSASPEIAPFLVAQ